MTSCCSTATPETAPFAAETPLSSTPCAALAPRPAVPSSVAAVQASADDAAVHAAHPKTPAPGRPIDLKREIETIELEQIHVALDLADGIISEAARLLSLKRTTLIEKMRKYGVQQQAA